VSQCSKVVGPKLKSKKFGLSKITTAISIGFATVG